MIKFWTKGLLTDFFGLHRNYCATKYDFLLNPISINSGKSDLNSSVKITKEVVSQLERLSLVEFDDEQGIKIVEDAISYASQLHEVDTEGVEPLITVLENECLYLREDFVQNDTNKRDLLSHAEKTLEGYYVAPVGNISFVKDDSKVEINNCKMKGKE